jgi:secondary thiamine-phosphate synthase enzyme
MKQHQTKISIKTKGRGLIEITDRIELAVSEAGITTGLCVVFCCHTSASLIIQENADPDVQVDLLAWLKRIAPDGDPGYIHTMEGPDDMAAHIRTALTRTSETIPISHGRLVLGTWQGLYLAEHRTSPHTRHIVVHVTGD